MRPSDGAIVSRRRPFVVLVGVILTARILVGDIGDAADIGIADHVDQPERSVAGRHFDQHLDVDVAVLDELPVPVTVGVHLRVIRCSPADARDDEGGQRQRRVRLGEPAPRRGDVDLKQPGHRGDPSTGAHGRGDQPPARRERPRSGAAAPFGRVFVWGLSSGHDGLSEAGSSCR